MRLLLLLLAVLSTGCLATGSGSGPYAEQQAYCRRLESRERSWAAWSQGASVLAGAGGLGTVAASDTITRQSLGVAVVVAAALAAYSTAQQAGYSADARGSECGRYLLPADIDGGSHD